MRQIVPKTNEEYLVAIAELDRQKAQMMDNGIKHFSISVKRDEIDGVRVFP